MIELPPPKYIDCCINNCILFYGTRSTMTRCFCGASRYREHQKRDGSIVLKPVNQMRYFSPIGRLIQMWANPSKARLWKEYRSRYDHYDSRSLDDYWSGDLHKNYHYSNQGLFRDNHDMAFQFSMDGVQATRMKSM